MRYALAMMVVGALVTGCGCERATGLVMTGESPPPATDIVLAVAQERCGRPLVGEILWFVGPPEDFHKSYCAFDSCGMDVRVLWQSPAMHSPLAHEIGHYCLQSEDNDAVDLWARKVNTEAWDRADHP